MALVRRAYHTERERAEDSPHSEAEERDCPWVRIHSAPGTNTHTDTEADINK